MTTELGKELRRIRVDRDEKLFDMANRIGKSSAFISSVETGKKSPPAGFEEAVIKAYDLDAIAAGRIRACANKSRTSFVLEPRSSLGRDTAGLMARRMNELSEEELESIRKILTNGSKPNGE